MKPPVALNCCEERMLMLADQDGYFDSTRIDHGVWPALRKLALVTQHGYRSQMGTVTFYFLTAAGRRWAAAHGMTVEAQPVLEGPAS